MGRSFADAPLAAQRLSAYLGNVAESGRPHHPLQVDIMELSVVRIHKATSTGGQPWVQARSVVHPDKYLSQCPFILLNEESYAPFSEFPIRSHDGVVAMTLVLDGGIDQTDGTGSHWRLEQGDADFTAGRGGVLRAEAAQEHGVRFLHLWLNLPPSLKPKSTRRQVVRLADARRVSFGDASVCVYAGSLGTAASSGPALSPWPITVAHVSLRAGARASLPLASTERGFAYVLAGTIELGRNQVRLSQGSVAWVERTVDPGVINALAVHAITDTRLLFASSPVFSDRAAGGDGVDDCAAPPLAEVVGA
jgi:redox-sensitive bicupin YhaK (pirin superfamily)